MIPWMGIGSSRRLYVTGQQRHRSGGLLTSMFLVALNLESVFLYWNLIIMWHVDSLLGNDLEIRNYTTTIGK
jgi:hypothetical protein